MRVARLLIVTLGLSAANAWAEPPPEAPAAVAKTETPEALDAQGETFFASGRYADAISWFDLAAKAAPTAERFWRLAMAHLGAGDLLTALLAVEHTLQLDPQHVGAVKTRPLLVEWLRNRGTSGNPVPMAPPGRSIRMVVLQALVDGDDVLARQLLPLWRSGPEKGTVAELVQAELWLRDNRLADADKVLRAILAKDPGHPGALKALAEVVILRGDFQQARGMLGLPAVRPQSNEDPNADLYRFVLRRHGEWQQQLRMAVDPGVKPLPALSQQLAESAPVPPPPTVEVTPPPTPEPAPVKPKHKAKRHAVKDGRPSVPKALMTRVQKASVRKASAHSKKSGK
jgi:Flp pilus assembly protein TadD